MTIVVNDWEKISEVQSEFRNEFPNLNIEFYDLPYVPGALMDRSKIYAADSLLGACRKVHNEGALYLTAGKTVGELERELWDNYGLSV